MGRAERAGWRAIIGHGRRRRDSRAELQQRPRRRHAVDQHRRGRLSLHHRCVSVSAAQTRRSPSHSASGNRWGCADADARATPGLWFPASPKSLGAYQRPNVCAVYRAAPHRAGPRFMCRVAGNEGRYCNAWSAGPPSSLAQNGLGIPPLFSVKLGQGALFVHTRRGRPCQVNVT